MSTLDAVAPWVLHEYPERPIDRWTWICACGACAIAVRAASKVNPLALACIKRIGDRELVSLAHLADLLDLRLKDSLVDARLSTAREIFVVGT